MSDAPRAPEVETYRFVDDGIVPNNAALPLVVYRGALAESGDRAAACEQMFARHGWGDGWRNGIYADHHYHSTAHEVLGIARGNAVVRFGGDNGTELAIAAGDVAILPAGTGHQCLSSSADFSIVGAYPPGARAEITRATPENHAKALRTIPEVKLPKTDPVLGENGPLVKLWKRG